LLANLFSLGGWLLFHRAAARRFGERTADGALALLVAFPGALFFQFIYSESLFFLLIMVLWRELEGRRYRWAWAAAFLAPLARGVGAFAVLPLAWHAWNVAPPGWRERLRARGRSAEAGAAGEARSEGSDGNAGEDGRPGRRAGRPGLRRKAAWAPWLLAGMPVAGWAAYLGLMWIWTGDPFSGMRAQRFWGVHAIGNLWDVPKFVSGFFNVTVWHGFTGSALDRIGFLFALYAAPMLWRRARDLLPWWVALAVLPAMSGTFPGCERRTARGFVMAFRQLSLGRLTGRRPGRWLDWAAPLGFGLALMVLTPWRTAFRFGVDEGFELMKALLVSRGHPLYGAFWNDQPPLHTELLAGLFRIFGPSAGMGRLLTMAFAMLLVGALYGLARRGSNRLTGVAAVGLLASASGFLKLSVSVMLEVPAFALGLASVWAWTRWQKDGRRRWLVVSGVLFGSALQVKFTVALLLPALAVDFALWAWRRRQLGKKGTSGTRRGGRSGVLGEAGAWWEPAAVWLGSAAAVFVGVMLLWYQPGTWKVFWASHFSANRRRIWLCWSRRRRDWGCWGGNVGGNCSFRRRCW